MATAMTMVQYQDRCAGEIAAARNCVCVAPNGSGVAAITHQAALLLHARRVLVCAPRGVILPAWRTPLDLAFQPGAADRVMDFSGLGKEINPCRAARLQTGEDPVFYLVTHNQISAVGAWCDSRRESPFDLIVADFAEAFANVRSERSKGLRNAALNGKIPCVGFVLPAGRPKIPDMPQNPWGGPRIIDMEVLMEGEG